MSTPQDPSSQDDRYSGPPYPPPPPGWTYPAPPPGTGLGPTGFEPADGPARVGPAAARPGSVVAAVICWVLAGIVLIGSGVLTIAGASIPETRQELDRMFAESELQFTDQVLRQVLLVAGVTSIVLGLVTIALGLLLLGGANWVRIALTVIGVLDVLMVLFGALFVAVAVVLQFLPSSNQWFRTRGPAPGT